MIDSHVSILKETSILCLVCERTTSFRRFHIFFSSRMKKRCFVSLVRRDVTRFRQEDEPSHVSNGKFKCFFFVFCLFENTFSHFMANSDSSVRISISLPKKKARQICANSQIFCYVTRNKF